MKKVLLFLLPALAVAQQFDAKACFEARGKSDPATIEALVHALDSPDVFSCAATDLRIAGAIEPLWQALESNDNPQVRAAAARELGSFQNPEMLAPLMRAAKDENMLVATNALAGLSQYQDRAVVPHLTELAKAGGMIGDMALDRLLDLDPAAAIVVARALLASPQVPDKLYAMRAIGAAGDATDLASLRKIAASREETLAQRNRGFGFMPPINLSRAAQSAIAAIEAR
jgi:HEAT repeat protein